MAETRKDLKAQFLKLRKRVRGLENVLRTRDTQLDEQRQHIARLEDEIERTIAAWESAVALAP